MPAHLCVWRWKRKAGLATSCRSHAASVPLTVPTTSARPSALNAHASGHPPAAGAAEVLGLAGPELLVLWAGAGVPAGRGSSVTGSSELASSRRTPVGQATVTRSAEAAMASTRPACGYGKG